MPPALQTTLNSGNFPMGTSSRIFQDTTPLSTLWLSILMVFWSQEVNYSFTLCYNSSPTKTISFLLFSFKLFNFLACFVYYLFSYFTLADNGTIHMWDWRTGYNFQRIHAAVQPGSLDSESGIFSCMFDQSESRLITAEADKTIKVYKEDDTAVSSRNS